MYALFLCLFCYAPPEPFEYTEADINLNIRNLSHDDYEEREFATQYLIRACEDLDERILKIQLLLDNTTDLEVKWRSKKILEHYYSPLKVTGPVCIWALPKEIRYQKDLDVSKMYFRKFIEHERVNHNHACAYEATEKFAEDWLKDKLPRWKLMMALEKAKKLWKEESGLLIARDYFYNYTYYKLPEPIEDRIKLLSSDDKSNNYFPHRKWWIPYDQQMEDF